MNDKSAITYETIAIDSSRRVNDVNACKVLLYDKKNNCYYETTVESILGLALGKFNEFSATIKQEQENFIASVSKTQSEFIKDSSKTISTLIDLVEGISK